MINLEHIPIKILILSMRVGGLTSILKGKEFNILIKELIQDFFMKEKNMELGSFNGITDHLMKDNFKREHFKVKGI